MVDNTRILNDESGYATNVFADKGKQMVQVCDYLEKVGFLPKELVKNEVQWFYSNLNIDDLYFALESVETIANHIMSLYGAKILAFTKNENVLDIHLQKETEDSAVYIHSSVPGVSQIDGSEHEKTIDEKFLDISTAQEAYRVESYRSEGDGSHIRSYFVTRCEFETPAPALTPDQELDIKQVADKSFLLKATEHTLQVYQEVMRGVLQKTGPVIDMFEVEGTRERRLVIGYCQRSTKGFFAAISDLYHYYDLYSTRKYVEQFSNGVTIIGLYLHPVPQSKAAPIEHTIYQVVKEASLLYCLPKTPLQNHFKRGTLSVQEMVYSYVGWIFSQHFLNRLGLEYLSLTSVLDRNNPVHEEVLSKLKKRLRQDTFTRDYILEIMQRYPELLKMLYVHFAKTHYVNRESMQPSMSYQRIHDTKILSDDEAIAKCIKTTTTNAHEQLVFECFLTFNQHILKTNFYQTTKVALAFRMDPGFLPAIEYPTRPYGMFLVVGSEFRGFHLRFSDVARGGIRMIRSRNREAYSINLRTLFDENYNLASTQHRKNKDIPEGGFKGTILLDIDQQDKPLVAFQKYVDAVLDLLVGSESGENLVNLLVDHPDNSEILFFGPDEGTAEYMDWASQHARRRGAAFWKAFTTGKSQAMGGIPHDLYGMTTRSVHQYVLGIYRTLGLDEHTCTKTQTGGPDGDLGSNEIKISSDKTIAVVDGSGVLYDPRGLDRVELRRLADARLMITSFDATKLTPGEGFRVLVDQENVTLPNGEIVDNGLQFRNTFHTNPLAQATLFVPCGGRPESIGLDNVHCLLRNDGPLYKYIVEGANLFITQEARLRLEKAGVVLFKDASANKGGVTSSSLEVLAALSFDDASFETNMCVKDNVEPAFYQAYVAQVQQLIEANARVEFEALWREHKSTKRPISIISDELSTEIVHLQAQLQNNAGLWENDRLRTTVLERAFPKLLLDTVGLDTLMKRVPENYIKAIFGAHLASQFVYKYGAHPDNFAFFEFMRENF